LPGDAELIIAVEKSPPDVEVKKKPA